MSATQTIDFSKYETKPTIDFAKYASAPATSQSQITGIKAEPEHVGPGERFARWAENVSNDIKYGSDTTGIGTVLKKMGAHGVYNGNSKAVGDYMASLPLGLVQAAKGVGESGTHPLQGAKDIAGGVINAATIPASMANPLEAEAAASGASKATTAIKSATPGARMASAGQKFQELKGAIGQHTVAMTDDLGAALGEIKEAVDSGTNLPPVINKFVNRITNLEDGPLSYAEARNFYHNVSDLAASDKMALNANGKRVLNQFRVALGNTIADTADQAGMLEKYQQAMKGFAQGKRLEEKIETAKKIAIGAAGGAGIYKGYQTLRDLVGAGR